MCDIVTNSKQKCTHLMEFTGEGLITAGFGTTLFDNISFSIFDLSTCNSEINLCIFFKQSAKCPVVERIFT